MADLRIVLDPEREWRPVGPNVIEVANEDDYYRARHNIRATTGGGSLLTIWVTAGSLAHRFDDLRSAAAVQVVEYDVRRDLADALGVSGVPDLVTADVIRSSDLIAKAQTIDRSPDEPVLSWTLRAVRGTPWGKAQVSDRDVPGILAALGAEDEWTQTLRDIIVWQLRVWQRNSYAGALWKWLAEAPAERARCVWACWATAGFGGPRTQWLTQEGHELADIDQAGEFVALLPGGLTPPTGAISIRLRQFIQSELAARLQASGIGALPGPRARLVEELSAAVSWLTQRATDGDELTGDEADALLRWGEDHRSTALGGRLLFLTQVLRVAPLPLPLAADADWAEVSHWLERAYLPAYLNRAVRGRLDETEKAVRSFERWAMSNYHRLMMQEEGPGLHWYAAELEGKRQDAAVVLLILDGVPHALVRWLRDELEAGTSLQTASEGTFLSLLPTTTAVNRPSLVTRQLPDAASPPPTGEEPAITIIREPTLPLAALQSVQRGDCPVYHWRMVDQDLLHPPMPALDRWLRAHSAVLDLGRSLKHVMRDAEQRGLTLWLGLVSDHGWTELPATAPSVPIPDDLLERVAHGRVLKGIADERYGLPLDASAFFLAEPYTLAATYGYYGSRPHGAVHGGATPQEMAVFGCWATNAQVPRPLDLGVEVVGEVARGLRGNPAVLRVRNPNTVAVDVLGIELDRVSLGDIRWPVRINAGGQVELSAVCDASTARNALAVCGRMPWRWRGQSQLQTIQMQVPTTGAAEADRGFEGMFDV
jgi:hypothetical protein